MIITAPTRFFQLGSAARSARRSCRLALSLAMSVIFIDEESAAARPFHLTLGDADAGSASCCLLVQGGREEMRFSIENVMGASGKPLRLSVTMPKEGLDIPRNPEGPFFLMFEGLPAKVTLSAGFRVKDGVWAVSFKDIGDLSLSAPADFTGAFDVRAVLRRGTQTDIQSHRFRVEFVTPAAIRSTPDHRQEAELFARVESLVQRGDLHAARSILTDLADRGSPEAMFRLAQTYDPQVLKSHFIVGVEPNLEKALELYRQASRLGVKGAQERLNQVSNSAR